MVRAETARRGLRRRLHLHRPEPAHGGLHGQLSQARRLSRAQHQQRQLHAGLGTSIYDALGQRIAVQQTEQLPGGTTSALARVFGYDGDNQILGRTDGTVSGTGSSATFAALAGGTTANPDAEAPPRYVKVAALTDEYLAAEGRPAALVRRVTGAISAPHETQRLAAGGKTDFHASVACAAVEPMHACRPRAGRKGAAAVSAGYWRCG